MIPLKLSKELALDKARPCLSSADRVVDNIERILRNTHEGECSCVRFMRRVSLPLRRIEKKVGGRRNGVISVA